MRRFNDKVLHIAAGALVAVITGWLGFWIGFATAASAGAAKEAYDYFSGKGTPEYADFVATCAGGWFGSFIWVII